MSLNTRHELFRCFRIWPFFLGLASGSPRDGVFRALAAAFLNSAARGMRWEARQGRNTGRISDFATDDLTHTCVNSDVLLRVSHMSNFSLRLACSDQNFKKYRFDKNSSHKETLSNGVVESLANAIKNTFPDLFGFLLKHKKRLKCPCLEHLWPCDPLRLRRGLAGVGGGRVVGYSGGRGLRNSARCWVRVLNSS